MTTEAYRDHPIRAQLQQMLELQKRPEFSESSVADNEQYTFARDKAFAITKLVDASLAQTPAVLASPLKQRDCTPYGVHGKDESE